MKMISDFPRIMSGAGSGEEAGQADATRAALARLVQLAPAVWPGVAVEADWNTALNTARDVLKPPVKPGAGSNKRETGR